MANQTYAQDVQTLEKILDEWEKDSVIDQTAPNDSLAKNKSNHAKYLRILARNSINIDKADEDYKEMRRLRLAYYEGTLTQAELAQQGWSQYLAKAPKTSTQRDELLESDPLLVEIMKRKKVYENIVKCCELILKEINSSHYSIKAYMDWELRIRQG
jgi:hypothetical protein